MGNTASNVTTGIKAQADRSDGSGPLLYQLVEVQGGGELIELMKTASATKDYTIVDAKIVEEVSKYLYNSGDGKMVPINEIIFNRSKQRQHNVLTKPKRQEDDEIKSEKFKEVCWKMDQRGAVGETILHLCLLNATFVHQQLAKRLLLHFPKLINDIYLSEEYYGESVLHMAIVNEDPVMVRFLLENDADYTQRCCGNFFTPEDQKSSRHDSPDQEWVNVSVETNYEGYMYKGEYPLAFAACLAQEECVRLLVAKGADPNAQDANGNTVMHMLVIHAHKEMFDLVHSLGGRLDITNRQSLTPLTLAAKLANKKMYEHILKKRQELYWVYGNVSCAAYPLDEIDTITTTGATNETSVLNIIVHGGSMDHLELMEGPVIELLNEKWKTFLKNRYLRRMITFLMYFCIFAASFLVRYGQDTHPTVISKITSVNATNLTNGTNTTYLITRVENVSVLDQCFLSRVREPLDIGRFVLEAITLGGAVAYLFLAVQELWIQKFHLFFVTLRVDPARFLFLLSCSLVLLMLIGRISCHPDFENILGVFALLSMAPYFLFFCRGFKFVGPFVVMIYNMITTDLLKFFTVYFIFLMGFSQAIFIVFLNYDKASKFDNPIESLLGLFVLSLGHFHDTYVKFKYTNHEYSATIVFVFYMILVTLLLLNMLIAMMESTYNSVAATKKEWLRQWAKILLVVEQSVSKEDRLQQRIKYSKPMTNGSRGFIVRIVQPANAQRESNDEWDKQNRRMMLAMMLKRTSKVDQSEETTPFIDV